jgi:type IV secretion system protein VirB9
MIKFLLLSFLFASCVTVDVEKNIRNPAGPGRQGGSGFDTSPIIVYPEIEIVYVERPVFVPEKEAPPRIPAAGIESVRTSNNAGIIRPQDFSHAAMIYNYHPDWVYEVYTQPLRVTNITLQPGERAVEAPFISDSERWILGAGVSYQNGIPTQHIYVKPEKQSQEASLIINTDRRVYHIILRSFRDVHMPIVRWRYAPGIPNNFISTVSQGTGASNIEANDSFVGIDPRFLSFNYRITYSRFRRPVWLPELVFDDGSKTYITFPNLVLQRELPAVFENRNDIINYRVNGNLIIIDKLIEQITIRIERTEITITKKRG